MDKRTIIFITIISTILSLIMIILSYFGFIRYLTLHIKNPEFYIKNYSKLPLNDKKIVVVINTTPKNLIKIKPTFNSILNQTIRVHQLIIVLPQEYLETKPNIPAYLHKIVTFIPAGKKYGSDISNSLIPVLLCEKENDTVIIILKDNIVYGEDFVETLINLEKSHPDTVLKVEKENAILVKPNYYDCKSIKDQNFFNEKWLLGKSKNSKIIKYTENYTRM
jgi:hypothetical protein